jgi:hypothetical protein
LLRARDAELYLEDNLSFDRAGKPAELALGEFKTLKEKPIWVEGLQPHTS